ncbi:MAG: [protein-PII] uridylyltransferase [Gammaproteobacteria bacterium]|nr:[protein-PII] uridylyltransferase [Gammaproteobacteria bacterium]
MSLPDGAVNTSTAAVPAPPILDDLCDTAVLDAALAAGGGLLPLLRSALRDGSRALREHFRRQIPADRLVYSRAWLIDQLLARAWHWTLQADADRLALVAVGGYGRGELLPHSDIDLLILLPDHETAALTGRLEAFLTLLWDIGLEVGHSVRTVDDCVREGERDITVATNFVEARLLAGAAPLFEAMREATGPERIWTGAGFFEAKLKEQVARHHKFHDTAYNLEPNIKESPGGLRDIQMIGWVAKRHFGVDTLHDLVTHHFLTEHEYRTLSAGQTALWRIRFALHDLTGRREDRILFDHQRTLAELLGYPQGERPNQAIEQFMKDYYRTVFELNRLNEMLLQLFQEAILYADDPGEPVPINTRFQARKGFIEALDEHIFVHHPFALLEIFLLLAQHPELKGVRAATIRLIRDHRHLIDDDFRNDLRTRSIFMEILRQPRGVWHELQRMNRYGILAAYLPVFGRIVGQMQYDLFHVYTVDEHSLFVLRNLRRFAVPEYAHEFPLCSELMANLPRQELLLLAGLFHDIAKGRDGDHSELGAEEAVAFCDHHGLSQHDTQLVAWLVRNHLLMSTTAQRRDISDPAVINDFARQMLTRTRLDYLYLLTVADIRATSPGLWNSWKNALLLELYNVAAEALARGLDKPLEQDEFIAETRSEAHQLLLEQGLAAADIEAIWRDLGEDYFLRHTPDEIAWHAHCIDRHGRRDTPLVELRHSPERGGTEVFIYTRTNDTLFERTTALLDQLGLDIHDARITTARNGYVLDTYLILDGSGTPIRGAAQLREIVARITRELSRQDGERPRVTRRPPGRFRHFDIPTQISFGVDAPNQRTVLELITGDRPGLLSAVGRAFSACGIRLQNARIATFGSRAEDVFYITDTHNRPLQSPEQFECLRTQLHESLHSADDGTG